MIEEGGGLREERLAQGRRERLGRVDRLDAGVRVLAAHEQRVQHAGQDEVGEVAALAGDQAQVLLAREAGAEPVTRLFLHAAHRAPPVFSRSTRAASLTARTMWT